MSKEAVDLLCWLNYKYWIDNNRKLCINKKISEINIEQEKQKRKQYNPNNLFKSTTKFINDETQQKSTVIIKYQEKNFLQKIFDKIKHLFKRK